jgi:hypothetical protein
MADIVKELYKGEVLFGNYVDGKQTLYSTDGTKTAVIKDVEIISSGYTTAPTLEVSDFTVATLSGNATGSEILGTNNSIKIKNNDTSTYSAYTIQYLDGVNTGTVYQYTTNPAEIVSSGIPTPAVSRVQGANVSDPGSQTSWAYVINGKVYWYQFDGNSTTNFYVRSALTGGSISNPSGNPSYTPVCFDGVSKFYWFYGSIYEHDAITGTTTSLGNPGGWSYGTTYPMIAYCNGIIFYQHTDGGNVRWYKVSNATYGNTVAWSYSNYCTNPTVFYDATNYTYRIVTAYGQGLNTLSSHYYFDIQSNAANSTFTYVNLGSGLNTKLNGNSPAIKIGFPSVNNKSYVFGASGTTATQRTVYSIDRNLNLTPIAEIGTTAFNNALGTITSTAATTEQLNTAGAKINLRITGVESTL